MRLSQYRIKDKQAEIGNDLSRSSRNKWAETKEELVRDLCPLPISYDVDSTQGLDFSEFSYTEYLGGLYLNTQNIEANTRIILEASQISAKYNHIEQLLAYCSDKYELNTDTKDAKVPHLAFMTGHNMFDLISREIVARIAFEQPDFMIKLHPLTNDEYASKVGAALGWDKVISPNFSGVSLLKNCDTAYVHTATELTSMAVLLDKKIVNISNFFMESMGIYYPINTLLFKSTKPKDILNNIIDCEFSGIIMPYMSDSEIETRVKAYYDKAMQYREILRPRASQNSLNKTPNKGCK